MKFELKRRVEMDLETDKFRYYKTLFINGHETVVKICTNTVNALKEKYEDRWYEDASTLIIDCLVDYYVIDKSKLELFLKENL